jgi:hypothetical protein
LLLTRLGEMPAYGSDRPSLTTQPSTGTPGGTFSKYQAYTPGEAGIGLGLESALRRPSSAAGCIKASIKKVTLQDKQACIGTSRLQSSSNQKTITNNRIWNERMSSRSVPGLARRLRNGIARYQLLVELPCNNAFISGGDPLSNGG